MSDLFNLSNILNEVSETFVQTDNASDILPMCIKQLQNIDDSIFESTTNLHVSLLEADSKKIENEKFADFFREYKNTIQSYIMQAKSLVSTFTINLETFADANRDLDCSTDVICDDIEFKGIEFANLRKDNTFDIQPYDVFKKEFAFIGKLMQDLGPMASENQKTQIIATVCNNLSTEIKDGWLNNCAKTISGNENVDRDGFARSMYRYFAKCSNTSMNIDIGLLKQCQLDIANYTQYIDSINESVRNFCMGLEKIRDEVGSLFFRNKDYKFPIKTNVDGIEDKVYRLNDYSFNQVNIFISTKISQINELCNLYMIALSIKMDCIYKYLKQCRDIINTANKTSCGDYCEYNNGIDTDLSDFDNDDIDFGEDDSKDVVHDDDDIDIKMECYLFEASIYEQSRTIKSLVYRECAYESLLEDSISGSTNQNNSSTGTNKEGFFKSKLKSIKAVIDNIIKRIKILIEKFKSAITKNYSKRIAYIRTNLQAINKAQIPTDWTIQKMNVDKLLTMKIQPLVEADFNSLQNTENYIKAKYPGIVAEASKENQSIKDRMMAICIPDGQKEVPYTNVDRQDGIKFVTQQYEDKALKSVEDNNKVIEKSRQNMDTLLAANESVISNFNDMMNFNEDVVGRIVNGKYQRVGDNANGSSNQQQSTQAQGNAAKEEQKTKEAEQKAEKQQKEDEADRRNTAINNYFSVSTELVTASMSIYITMVNKHLKFLEKLASISGYKA